MARDGAQPLSDEAAALYARVKQELAGLGAVLVDDPFGRLWFRLI